MASSFNPVALDIECYPNYYLAMFMSLDGRCKAFERSLDRRLDFDNNELFELLNNPILEHVTFNGNSYDLPVTTLALTDASCAALKSASDEIIQTNLRPWEFYQQYAFTEPKFRHIDLIEVAPGKASLKIYMGRMHAPKMQDLPYDPAQFLTPEEMKKIKQYCKNDLHGTIMLLQKLDKQLELRRALSRQYKINLMSKSDAQIAEAVLKTEYRRKLGHPASPSQILYTEFKYVAPEYVRFRTAGLRHKLDVITDETFCVNQATGHIIMPEGLDDMTFEIGSTVYKIGIGGLHSQESEVSHHTDEHVLIIDRDVASYYPNLILNMEVAPPSFGVEFAHIYRDILNRRMDAKRSGDKTTADSLKITLNGTFGKLANKYSLLYSPKDMLRTTLTGQLSLLMLIELLELIKIPVVSANTDGIVIKCPRDRYDDLNKVVAHWEKLTNLETEESIYKSLYSRDVNNYIAVKEDGGTKGKGVYSKAGLQKNPQHEIVVDAVTAYLTDQIDPKETITQCRDITKFLCIRTVRGGAVKGDKFLGKAVRWYYGEGETGTINYKSSGNKVPKSLGAKPCMDLPDEFPDDINYDWYYNEVKRTLWDIAALPRPVLDKIPRKNSKAWKALFEDGEIVENEEGKYEWNREIQRNAEVEAGSLPVVIQSP